MENEIATLGAGCFWCVEAVFAKLKGVRAIESGYTGGKIENPTCEQVCGGSTGHAEVIRVTFDPSVITYRELLTVFFHTHDPTTLNQQGNDLGTQYRSAIYYHSETQKGTAEEVLHEIEASDLWENPIVTEITAASDFYSAEEYHQNYFDRNPAQPYCSAVIPPKLKKLYSRFPNLIEEKQ